MLLGEYVSNVNLRPNQRRIRKTDRGTKEEKQEL